MGKFRFGTASMKKLTTCHPLMIEVFEEAILRTPRDFTIVQGWRGKADQDAAVKAGASKTPWPTSKHNHMNGKKPESWAVDFAPWYEKAPNIRWKKGSEFLWLAGFIIGVGTRIVEPRGFRLRYGGDFNGDGDLTNDKFIDNDHVELVPL